MREIEFVYLPRRKWPKRIREFFAQQKEAIEKAIERKAILEAIKPKG